MRYLFLDIMCALSVGDLINKEELVSEEHVNRWSQVGVDNQGEEDNRADCLHHLTGICSKLGCQSSAHKQ